MGKNKKEAGHQVRENEVLGAERNFLLTRWLKVPKLKNNYLVWSGSSTIFYLNQKQKSYVTLKLVNSEFLKNMVPPYETNVTVSNIFTWDEMLIWDF